MEVNKFRGYKFIYDYNSFIINMVLYETHKNLEVLYKYLPELLDIDLVEIYDYNGNPYLDSDPYIFNNCKFIYGLLEITQG